MRSCRATLPRSISPLSASANEDTKAPESTLSTPHNRAANNHNNQTKHSLIFMLLRHPVLVYFVLVLLSRCVVSFLPRQASRRTARCGLKISTTPHSTSPISPAHENTGIGHIDPPEQPYISLSSLANKFQGLVEKAATSLLHLDVTEDELNSSYLVHQGVTTPILLRAPSVGSFSLVRGWTNKSLESFTKTVTNVVTNNPILTGRAVSIFCGNEGNEIHVIPGAFDPDSGYSFVDVIDARDRLPSPETVKESEYLQYIDKHIQPLVPDPCAPTLKQMEHKEALFKTKVVLLPDQYACIFIGMSHVLGDIVTYTALMDQLSSLHDAHKPRPIKWNNAKQASHQISAENFSERDTQVMYGLPFLLGVSANLWRKTNRQHEYLSLSKEKINAKRKELCNEENSSLSSNDIITAALCEANKSSDIFAFTRTMRELHRKEYKDMGGNLYVEVPFARTVGSDPNHFRQLIKRGWYYDKGELPLMPFLKGKVGRITSCVAPISVHMAFGESETVCQEPPHDFVYMTPFDNAVIFTMDHDHIGVMHNFQEIDKSGSLLGEIMA